MKVIIYMAVSVDGFIAREDGRTDFVSDREWEIFRQTIKEIGNIVVGRRTYEVMKADNEFKGFEDVQVVVVSGIGVEKLISEHLVVESPKEALSFLKEKGFEKVLVAGGSVLNTSFVKEGLVDEVYLDEEPRFLGRGIKLFSNEDLDIKLEKIGEKYISPQERQTHWKINK